MQDSPTVISHLWKGAAPNLIAKAMVIIILKIKVLSKKTTKIDEKMNKIEARVWVKKYLIAASLLNLSLANNNRGIKVRVFNSSPSQEINNEGAEITNNTLIKIPNLNKKIAGVSHIGKEVKPINGAWAH